MKKAQTELKAYLHLENGQVFEGKSIGASEGKVAEVVFSTGMTGYCESMTDPSFAGQILTFTYPLIGNYGVPKPEKLAEKLMKNFESERVWVEGVVVNQESSVGSHWESEQTFSSWLKKNNIPGISLLDTRQLTQMIREEGCMKAQITSSPEPLGFKNIEEEFFVAKASISKPQEYTPEKPNGKTLALIDCGVKHGILRQLLKAGYKVIRVPWNFNPLDLKQRIDGVVCSNGPGNPKDCMPTVENIRKVLASKLPYIGICLGHQLLALAIGADTYKLPYGHRGLNQPCQDVRTKKAYLTSQNHGFAVKADTLPKGFQEWFINLNDGTNEGIICEEKKIWSVQFHPEGNPGPFDTDWIFELLK